MTVLLQFLKYKIFYDMASNNKKNKPITHQVCLDGSAHTNVLLTLHPLLPGRKRDSYGRDGSITFYSDGMDIEIFLMEKDARTLANFLLKHTNDPEHTDGY
jgi:hypothetical protein